MFCILTSYDTNKDPEYWRKAGLGPPANPVVQEQAMYSEERQREQIRMQVRAELEAEFEKKRQVERQAAWEREEKEREIQRRVAERERERERDYDRNQDWDYNRGGYSGGKGGKGQSGRPDGRYSRDWTVRLLWIITVIDIRCTRPYVCTWLSCYF